MIYTDFQGEKVSALGWGAMRLPLLEDGKTIDRGTMAEMLSEAMSRGINYFDTAFPYHGGMSEVVLGELLKDYPRDSWFISDKYPGHQQAESYDPADVFERQLKRCGVDYFDFYLLHNVCESSYYVYTDPKWGIVDYFVEQKRLGRIRHLGFSSHAEVDTLRRFLDTPQGAEMEMCQIELNYIDWTLQKANEKYALLQERNIPIWVMEPLRGGFLCKLPTHVMKQLDSLRPGLTPTEWAMRWLQSIPGVAVVLSGMSAPQQMRDNLHIFETFEPLTSTESETLLKLAEELHTTVPCTGCRYCCDECPQQLDIPTLIAAYNDLSIGFNFTPMMRLEALPEDRHPSACQQCGACTHICPQGIDIPNVLKELSTKYESLPKWSEICRQRAAEAKE